MPLPIVASVAEDSPAARAGIRPGDQIAAMNGSVPKDVIEYRLLADEAQVEISLRRPTAIQAPKECELSPSVENGHLSRDPARGPAGEETFEAQNVMVVKSEGEPLGIEVSSAVFDRVQTCDNHCEFCFIYQLPKGMRRSLYLKDDDYRLSFLYGNFTTLTRFTEMDLERVVTQRLGPLFVSIHTTDPDLRAKMLRNPRGAISLRWLRALLDHGIEVHGQVVVCPGVNDKEVLDETLVGVLDSYPELASIAVVPVGVSKWSKEPTMRPHSAEEAAGVLDAVAYWQQSYLKALGRRMVFAADEYYLLANRCLPEASEYEGFPQHENGIGMARAFREAFLGDKSAAKGVHRGFFSSVDGAPAAGYRAPRVSDLHMTWSMPDHCHGSASSGSSSVIPISLGKGAGSRRGNTPRPGRIEDLPVAIVTAPYGAQVLEPLIPIVDRDDIRIVTVKNETFGGNIAVTGLMSGADIARALSLEPAGHRYLLPDACLSQGRFLDDLTPMDLPRDVEVLPSDGWSLRMALEGVLK